MPSPLADVVAEHAEEAAFLWLLREITARSPVAGLARLAEVDERVEAHLDGIRVGGVLGWECCRGALAAGDAGEVFAAAATALDGGDPARLAAVLVAVEAAPHTAPGLGAALAWAPFEPAVAALGSLLRSPSDAVRAAGLAGAVTHAQDPGVALTGGLDAASSLLRAAACDAAGRLRRRDLRATVSARLGDPDRRVRLHAAVACVLLGDDKGRATLRELAETPGVDREAAARVAPRTMDAAAGTSWQRMLARDPGAARVAVVVAGGIGDTALVPWLVEQAAVPALARLAGESIRLLTGVDLEAAGLVMPSEPAATGPTDDPDDDDVGLDPDDGLPWPDPARLAPWWAGERARFRSGERHLLGHPIAVEPLNAVLRLGRQRERAAAALELALLPGCPPLFDVLAPAVVQRRLLGA
jgi:uncharacterized protein (TIGR02270 family)